MKRHATLQDLSRDHYRALKLALQAKRAALAGAAGQVETVAADCRAAFAGELEPHFFLEEDSLLPMLVQAGEAALVERLRHDHGELRRLSAQLTQPDAATLLAFAELLTAHVRFEEREMFAVLETILPADSADR